MKNGETWRDEVRSVKKVFFEQTLLRRSVIVNEMKTNERTSEL